VPSLETNMSGLSDCPAEGILVELDRDDLCHVLAATILTSDHGVVLWNEPTDLNRQTIRELGHAEHLEHVMESSGEGIEDCLSLLPKD
jgi:hypothetical protein